MALQKLIDVAKASVTVSDTVPSTTDVGSLWFESDTAQFFIYYDNTWIEVGGAAVESIINTITGKGQLLVGTESAAVTNLAVGSDNFRLIANSATTSGLQWVADTYNTVIDAKGDLLVGSADNTVTSQAVGTNGQMLYANSATSSGLAWDWNKIVQVVISSSGGTGGVSSTSQTKVSTGLSVTITPKSSSNYIIYFMSVSCMKTGGSSAYTSLDFELRRNGTGIISQNGYLYTAVAGETFQGQYSFFYTDYPATTSALTYELFFSLHPYANGTVYCQPSTGAGYQVSRLVALEVTP